MRIAARAVSALTHPFESCRARKPVGHFRVVDVVSVDADERVVGESLVGAMPVVSCSDNSERELDGGRARCNDVEHHARRYLQPPPTPRRHQRVYYTAVSPPRKSNNFWHKCKHSKHALFSHLT